MGERATSLWVWVWVWVGMEAPSLFGRPDSAQARQDLTRVGPETERHCCRHGPAEVDCTGIKQTAGWLLGWLAGRLAGRRRYIAVPAGETREKGNCPDRGNRQGSSWQALSNGQTGSVIAVKKEDGRTADRGRSADFGVLVAVEMPSLGPTTLRTTSKKRCGSRLGSATRVFRRR